MTLFRYDDPWENDRSDRYAIAAYIVVGAIVCAALVIFWVAAGGGR